MKKRNVSKEGITALTKCGKMMQTFVFCILAIFLIPIAIVLELASKYN